VYRIAILAIASLLVVLPAAPARGQSAYVTGVAGAEVSRFSRAGSADIDLGGFNGGEAPLLAVRVGTSLSERWGVELEFARPSAFEGDRRRFGDPVPLVGAGRQPGATDPIPDIVIRPVPVDVRIHLEQRTTTFDALAWIRQRVGSKVDLVYLGGLSLNRTVREVDADFPGLPIVRPGGARLTAYGSGPVAGFEARIAMTEHVHFVPGVRIHGLSGQVSEGWLIRPGVGLGWSF